MVKRFVDKADQTTRDEIEKLVAGGFVEKQLRLDLTYDEIDNTIDNLWSVLLQQATRLRRVRSSCPTVRAMPTSW